jgi:uncharacterized membrane protein YgcG
MAEASMRSSKAVEALAVSIEKSASASASAAAAPKVTEPCAADFGLSASEWPHHPHHFSKVKAAGMLCGIRGESEASLSTRNVLTRITRETRPPKVPAEEMTDDMRAEAIASLILGPRAAVASTPSMSMRRALAGLVSTATVLTDLGVCDANPVIVKIPMEALRPKVDPPAEGEQPSAVNAATVDAVIAIGEFLMHVFETAGRARLLVWMRKLEAFARSRPTCMYAYTTSKGTQCILYLHFLIRALLKAYAAFLGERPAHWSPAAFITMIAGPHPQFPLTASFNKTDILRTLVLWGVLDHVNSSQPHGAIIGESLIVFEKGMDSWVEKWHAMHVDCKANRDLVEKYNAGRPVTASVPSGGRSGGGGGGSSGGGGGGGRGGGGRDGGRGGRGDTTLGKRTTPDSATDSQHQPPPPAWSGPPATDKTGDKAITPSMTAFRKAGKLYTKCHWIDSVEKGGRPCTGTLPAHVMSKGGSAHPLCNKHKEAFDALKAADRSSLLTALKKAGVDVA